MIQTPGTDRIKIGVKEFNLPIKLDHFSVMRKKCTITKWPSLQ
jgi:hypothetical protein